MLIDPVAADVFLEDSLSERPRALVGVLLRRDELRRHFSGSNRPPEPHAGKQRLRRRPRLQDHVGGKAPETRLSFVFEAELAVSDVLDDQEAVTACEPDQQLASFARK